MKKPFKVGDRVRAFDGSYHDDGVIRHLPSGSVLYVTVVLDGYKGCTSRYHPKQLRRLVKRKKREYWLEVKPNGAVHHVSTQYFMGGTLFREVRKK